MNEKNRPLLVLLGFVVLIVFAVRMGSADQVRGGLTKWEYKVTDVGSYSGEQAWEEVLNSAGDDGWELVDITPVTRNGFAQASHATFKRPKR